MLAELGLRFLLGGLMVSLFAAIGECFQPKTLAGIFGAAPSVAIATLALAFATHGKAYVSVEVRTMIGGAAALFAYSSVCVVLTPNRRIPVWAGAAAAWLVWFLVALGLWYAAKTWGILR
jgi:hypothetical protein